MLQRTLKFIFTAAICCLGSMVAQAQNAKTVDSLETVLKTAKDDTTRLNIYVALVDACDVKDNLKYGTKALELADKLWPNARSEAAKKDLVKKKKYLYPAIFYYYETYRDSTQGVLKFIAENVAFLRQLKDTAGIIQVHDKARQYYYSGENYPRLIQYLRTGLANAERIQSKPEIAYFLSEIASTYFETGNTEYSLVIAQKAIPIYEELKDTVKIAQAYMKLGNRYRILHENEKANTNYQKAIDLQQLQKDTAALVYTYAVIGMYYERNHDIENALATLTKGLEITEHYPSSRYVIVSLIGDIYRQKKDFAKALAYNNMYLDEFRRKSGYGALVYFRMAQVYYDIKNYRKAKAYIDTSVAQYRAQQGDIHRKRDAELLAFQIDSSMDNHKEAHEHYIQYLSLRDKLFNADVRKTALAEKFQADFDAEKERAKTEQDKKDALAQQAIERQKMLRNGLMGGFTVVLLFSGVVYTQRNRIKKEKKLSDELLLNILPEEVAEELKSKGSADARMFDDVTVLFTDFKSFTTVSERLTPQQLVDELHACFSAFDKIMTRYNIEKIKTVGDAYLAVSGLPMASTNHATDVVRAAIEIREFIKQRKTEKGDNTFDIRIGIHSGSVVAGIVGVKKFAYDIWGDTVNTAARMEQNSEAGRINISQTTYELVKDKFTCEYRGEIEAKNKGKLKMYFVG